MQRRCSRPGGKHFFEKSKRKGIDYDCKYCAANWVAIRWALFEAIKDPNVTLVVTNAGHGYSQLIMIEHLPIGIFSTYIPKSLGNSA